MKLTSMNLHQITYQVSNHVNLVVPAGANRRPGTNRWTMRHPSAQALFIQPGHVVVDVGAHVGTLTLPLAKLVGTLAGEVVVTSPQSLAKLVYV